MKKYLRVLYLIPASFVITILVFAYRYVWFSTETIPIDRVMTAGLIAFVSCMIIPFVELMENK